MDWFTLVMIVIFFVLPLIQQIAEARKRGSEPPVELPEEEWEYEEEHLSTMDSGSAGTEARRSRGAETDGEWSEGWGSWPGEIPVPIPVPETPPARSPDTEVRQAQLPEQEKSRWERGRNRVPVEREAPVRLERPVPTPRPERVLIDRTIPAEPASIDRPEESRRPRQRVLSRPAVGEVRAVSPMSAVLHDGSQLRQALVLSEILGRPRALRPLEDDRE